MFAIFPAFFQFFSWKTTIFRAKKTPNVGRWSPRRCLRGGLPELQQHAPRGGRRAEALELLGAQVLPARSIWNGILMVDIYNGMISGWLVDD